MAKSDASIGNNQVNRRSFLTSAGIGTVAVMSALSGCSRGSRQSSSNQGTQTGQSGKPTLNIWLSYITEGNSKKEYTKNVFDEFQKQTGITINMKGVAYTDIVKKFRAARASGNAPHLVEVMTRPSILAGDVGLVINDLWESSELADKTTETVMKGHKVWGSQSTGKKGNLVTAPLGFRPYLSCWRTDWLKQAGIPKEKVNYKAGSLHWEKDVKPIFDALKQTKLGQKKEHYPSSTGMKQSDEEYMSMYIPQFGGSLSGVVNLTGDEATIDTKEARNAVSFQKKWIEQGYFDRNSINNGDEESTTLHWSGKNALNHIQDTTDLWADYMDEQPKATESGAYTWGLPMHQKKKAALAWLPSLGFIAESFSGQTEKDAAMRLLEWWIGDKNRAVENAKKLGFVPVFPDAIQTESYFGKTKIHEEFWRGACLKTLKNMESAVIPAVKGGQKVTYEIPRRMHVRIMQEGMSVKKATKMANNEINQTLNSG